jgi:signal transduction histidine kinase
LAAVGGLAIALAARLSKPIQSLQQQVGQLAQGDFQTVDLPARNDELRDLGASVNQLAEQLAEMRRVIKRSERLSLLGQLSGGLAHHLRNDVAGARIAIQLHEQDCSNEDAETLAVALRQLTLAEQHLMQFLAAGQPRAPRRTMCDVRDLLSELGALVGPTFRHQKVDLAIEFLADDSNHLRREIDAEQLRQAMLNLVLNALEAAGPKGSVRIVCDCLQRASFCIRVFDSGPGVTAAIADRLFEPFTTSRSEGVGLGLTVARQIAEGHGGTVCYRRTAETCFEIELPIAAEGESPNSSTLNPEPISHSKFQISTSQASSLEPQASP